MFYKTSMFSLPYFASDHHPAGKYWFIIERKMYSLQRLLNYISNTIVYALLQYFHNVYYIIYLDVHRSFHSVTG